MDPTESLAHEQHPSTSPTISPAGKGAVVDLVLISVGLGNPALIASSRPSAADSPKQHIEGRCQRHPMAQELQMRDLADSNILPTWPDGKPTK
ncbi:hypothetical protein IU469_30215 [Nocardia puris]|uniref:hypothetical protein n=1 Tax=Nocardia puris TaxID=208602 RepID=UPI000AA1920B|nr:hypothetical protein [Nocardia puris]MBF6215425.1 hypothetical protein [Nocardia puris]MBF6369955.1 hypothetical protein [Nocardia puris]